jgi:homoserine O-acetyltransferase
MAAAAIPGDHMANAGLGAPEGCKLVNIGSLDLECGRRIESAVLAASCYGTLNDSRDNAILVGHSLTSNSHIHAWWSKLLSAKATGTGDKEAHGKCLDSSKYFIVCFNYLGSCYGSSSPLTEGGMAGFGCPVTMRDQARAMLKGMAKLGVEGIAMAMGGSMGAMLALELAFEGKGLVRAVCAIAGCAQHT